MRILILGGYGVFGRKAVERLAHVCGMRIIVAGRDLERADDAVKALKQAGGAQLSAKCLDVTELTAQHLQELGVEVVLNAAGPFQVRDYRVAEAAIGARSHYIDLADARGFVCGIGKLDTAAKAAGVLVVSGASSVPALAAAVIDEFLPRFKTLTEVTYGISPGNSFNPGLATVTAIIGGAGKAFSTLVDGRYETVHGWHPLQRRKFCDPRVGTRWLGHCDVPDLDLFPQRYRTLRTLRFLAGVEVKAFHAGVWAIAWLSRLGLAQRPERFASAMLRLKRRLDFLGSDRGAMFVHLRGQGTDGGELGIVWEMVAEHGNGPFIPATPAVILVKRLMAGTLGTRGAMPCVGLMSLRQFSEEVADLDIRQSVQWARPFTVACSATSSICLP